MSASEEQSQGPVIRDRRRIDPVTGQPRQTAQSSSRPDGEQGSRGAGQARPGKHSASKPGGPRTEAAGPGQAAAGQAGPGEPGTDSAEAPGAADDVAADLTVKLAERTADLQRVQAEYANYRKRVERDRTAVRELALAGVLSDLLPVLDNIGRAREHEELTGGFKAVADALESAAARLGLATFGKPGEAFDPNVHEALMHSYSADVTEPTCVQVLQPGYKVGERILRPARVAVAEPTDPAGARTADDGPAADGGEDEPGEDGQDPSGAAGETESAPGNDGD